MNIITSHAAKISHRVHPQTVEGELLVQRMAAEWLRLVNLRLLFEVGELRRAGTVDEENEERVKGD